MISVVTPTYRTDPDVLARTWASLKAQTYTDWEWVVWDDTPGDEVWRQLYGLAADERYRLIAHRSHVPSGSIGRVKRRGFMVAEGDVLVELDHDDELTPDALEAIADAFTDPNVGFVFSDWSEILPSGESGRYPEGWAFGYGSDYFDADHGVWVMRAPELNAVTLGHIVSAPNHVRAWRASVYRQLGGHDPALPVADDYDLVVRTALATTCVHVPRMLYRQHIGPSTAQRQRNEEIQVRVAEIAGRYAEGLAERYGGAT
jgi:glycosyltransferase involved in cell wall biosynthesis